MSRREITIAFAAGVRRSLTSIEKSGFATAKRRATCRKKVSASGTRLGRNRVSRMVVPGFGEYVRSSEPGAKVAGWSDSERTSSYLMTKWVVRYPFAVFGPPAD